jgi:hypothetical protein
LAFNCFSPLELNRTDSESDRLKPALGISRIFLLVKIVDDGWFNELSNAPNQDSLSFEGD